MAKEASIEINCQRYSDRISEVIELLDIVGWSFFDEDENVEYLPLGDRGDYNLQSVPALGKAQMAGIMAATVLMGNDPDAPANGRMLDALAQRVGKQSSFRRLSRDPDALRLARGGKGAEMIVRMGEIKRQHDAMLRRYDRSAAQTAQDAVLFRAAVKSMKDSFANQSPAQRERESQRFLEMVKRLDHARSLAEQGIPLDGKSARELAQAVQFYNNGGSKTPGGKKQAAASKEAMCVLKRVMPEEDFKGYCADINRTHKAESPTHRRHADPNAYTEACSTAAPAAPGT